MFRRIEVKQYNKEPLGVFTFILSDAHIFKKLYDQVDKWNSRLYKPEPWMVNGSDKFYFTEWGWKKFSKLIEETLDGLKKIEGVEVIIIEVEEDLKRVSYQDEDQVALKC